MKYFSRINRGKRGQSIIEYVLLLTGLVLAFMAAKTFFEGKVSGTSGGVGEVTDDSLAGKSGKIIEDAANALAFPDPREE